MKKLISLSLVLAVIFVIPACAKKEQEKRPIKIGINIWPGYAHAFIAQEKGFFTKNGVAVDLILKKETLGAKELYKNGEVDGFFTLLPDAVMLDSEGIDTKLVYVADYSETGDVIIGKPGLNSLADLKNKRISCEGINTFSQAFVLKALEKAGLKEYEVQFADIPAHEVLNALENGAIEAGHTWEPTKSAALNKGYKILATAKDVPGVIIDCLAFSGKAVEERPEDIKRIIKSLLEARDFIYSNKDEALEIMARGEKMKKAEMESGLQGVYQPDLKENIEVMKKSGDQKSLYAAGENIAEFFLHRGQLSDMPDLSEIIEPKFINALAGEK